MSPPRVIFLFGPVASGKLTIGRELSALTGLALFHNHLTVDLLLALFPFGSPPFVQHREQIWLDLMEAAVKSGRSLIFTFSPERTVSPDFPAVLSRRIVQAGGLVSLVEVVCAEAEIERRMEAKSRQSFLKLTSLEQYRQLKRDGAFVYPLSAPHARWIPRSSRPLPPPFRSPAPCTCHWRRRRRRQIIPDEAH